MELAAPGHPTVYGWRAYIADAELDPVTAARFYERALAIDPHNEGILRGVISFLLAQGNIQDAVVTAEYLVQQDPLCVMCLQHLSWAYRATGEYERAVEVLQEAVEWNPNRGLIYWSLGSVLLMAGRPQEALQAFALEESDMGDFGRIFALHDLGRQDEFEKAFDAILYAPVPSPEAIARIYAWMGETELAIEYLQKTLDELGAGEIGLIMRGGFYRKIESDPLFEAFLRKNGQHPDMLEPVPFNFTPPKHAQMKD
jgi:tetratricopeptide (TPR) repeat protein